MSNPKYECKKCGEIVKSIRHEAPNPGTYYTAKCECGNKGNTKWSQKWDEIEGFIVLENHQ